MANLTRAQFVRQRREAMSLSREALAHDSAVSTSTIVRLERDGRAPNVEALKRITDRLDLSIDELMAHDEAVSA